MTLLLPPEKPITRKSDARLARSPSVGSPHQRVHVNVDYWLEDFEDTLSAPQSPILSRNTMSMTGIHEDDGKNAVTGATLVSSSSPAPSSPLPEAQPDSAPTLALAPVTTKQTSQFALHQYLLYRLLLLIVPCLL